MLDCGQYEISMHDLRVYGQKSLVYDNGQLTQYIYTYAGINFLVTMYHGKIVSVFRVSSLVSEYSDD